MSAIIAAIFGLAIGSFLNVVIYRLHAGKSFASGRSACPHCDHELQVTDMIPLFSFAALGGKCRYCRKPISWQYPIVESATALVFALVAIQFPGFGMQTFSALALSSMLIVIGVYDFKHYLILDKVVFSGLALATLFAVLSDLSNGCFWSLNCATVSGIFGGLIISGFFYGQYVLSSGRWIGFGDVKLGLMLGMIAGFPLIIFTMFLSYTLGALVGVTLIGLGKKEMGSKLPFGTFLAAGSIFGILYGQPVLHWYLKLIGLAL